MAICKAQQKGEFYDMQTAIIPLLKQALSAQQGKFQAILSGELGRLGLLPIHMMPNSHHANNIS